MQRVLLSLLAILWIAFFFVWLSQDDRIATNPASRDVVPQSRSDVKLVKKTESGRSVVHFTTADGSIYATWKNGSIVQPLTRIDREHYEFSVAVTGKPMRYKVTRDNGHWRLIQQPP